MRKFWVWESVYGKEREKALENITEAAVSAGKKGITGSTLKLIAIIAMFIDHTGAVIVERMLLSGGASQMNDINYILANANLYIIDMVLRLVGRLGFPIFCFLLIEGFQYTRNVKKYAGRLFLFALISEVPFDLGFSGELFYSGYQNVFFTLFTGLLVMIGFRLAEEKTEWNKGLRIFFQLAVLVVGAGIAELLRTDYGAFGVFTIVVMYLFRRNKVREAVLGCAALTAMSFMEITSFFVIIPIHMYNGKRGWNIKWLFYAFYPLHIFLLYMIAYAMGLGQVALR